jgi:hypothetical protein
MEFTRQIDNSIYSRKALAAARDAYRPYCEVVVKPGIDGKVGITVAIKDEHREQDREVVLEFWNFFLDTSCQQRLESA